MSILPLIEPCRFPCNYTLSIQWIISICIIHPLTLFALQYDKCNNPCWFNCIIFFINYVYLHNATLLVARITSIITASIFVRQLSLWVVIRRRLHIHIHKIKKWIVLGNITTWNDSFKVKWIVNYQRTVVYW